QQVHPVPEGRVGGSDATIDGWVAPGAGVSRTKRPAAAKSPREPPRDLPAQLPARRFILPAVSYRVAVAVSGRGSNLLALGEALAASREAELVRVISDREAPALEASQARGWPIHR